jgi:hypothetical protein
VLLVTIVCISGLIVLIALAVAIKLLPEAIFTVPLRGAVIPTPRPPIADVSLADAVGDERAYFERAHVFFRLRLQAIAPRLQMETELLTAHDAREAGLDPDKVKAMEELAEKIANATEDSEFTEAAQHLVEIVKECIGKLLEAADTAGDAAGTVALAGSLVPLIGPLFAVMVACASMAVASRQARETASIRRGIADIANLLGSRTTAEFEQAYIKAQSDFGSTPRDRLSLLLAQRDLNVAKRTWLIQFVKKIESAPNPYESRFIFFSKRVTDFDRHISEGFAPVARYLAIGVFADFFITDDLGNRAEFLNTLTQDLHYLTEARNTLEERMRRASIQGELDTPAALIYQWLNERCAYYEAFAKAVTFIPTLPQKYRVTFTRRVRYLALLVSIKISKNIAWPTDFKTLKANIKCKRPAKAVLTG